MIEVVPDTEYQALDHFASKSPWNHRLVMDQVALDSDRHLGGTPDTGLIIGETAIPKKGKKSVGVARQWCGRLGKVDNYQVGVFASLVRGPSAALIPQRRSTRGRAPSRYKTEISELTVADWPVKQGFNAGGSASPDVCQTPTKAGIY